MTSIKRTARDTGDMANITSKVFVRSAKSGRVTKVVREIYLRTDIPCSSKLCIPCTYDAPTDSSGRCKFSFANVFPLHVLTTTLSTTSSAIYPVRTTSRHISLHQRSLSSPRHQHLSIMHGCNRTQERLLRRNSFTNRA